MCNGYVVDLIVIELRIAMRENVAEPYDVAGVRNCFRNRGRHSVEIAHGLAADFQHALHRRSGLRYCSRLNPDVKRTAAAA